MKKLTRIVTFVNETDKTRLFAVRRVVYDDNMTPLYTEPYGLEMQFETLQELYKVKRITPLLQECPILDIDHSLKVYNHD